MVQTLSIRTKLIMAMLALVATVTLMGVTADTANAGVTEIRKVYNYTDRDIYIWNHESGARVEIGAGKVVSFNQWVPWATSKTDFNRGHFIEVGNMERLFECGGARYCARFSFWQENLPATGDKIRYTSGEVTGAGPLNYKDNAQAMPGASDTDGWRRLIIKDLGRGWPVRLDVSLERV